MKTATTLLFLVVTAATAWAETEFADNGDGTYTISNAEDWNAFCDALQDNNTYNRFSGKTVKLDADITVNRMAGSEGHEFCGTFDGQRHILTVNISNDNDYAAPFRDIMGAAIRNLKVSGSVSGHKHSAGLVSCARGADSQVTNTIENCLVATDVSTIVNTDGDCYLGGIVGHGFKCKLTIRGCAFTGSLTSPHNYTGGLQGWSDGNALTLEDDIFVASNVSAANVGFHPIAFHNNNASTTATVSNVYYTVAPTCTTASRIAAAGNAVHTVKAGTDVTVESVALTGTPTTYDVSGITAYSGGGLAYDGKLYYGGGDQLSLTLSNTATDAPLGYSLADGYTASAGTLDGSTLTMPDGDVTISVALAPIDWATQSNGDADHPYIIYNKDQLDLLAHRVNGTHGETLQTDGYSGKYFKLANDIAYSYTKAWNDATSTENNYEAIGGYYDGNFHNFFGNFDGAGHTVSGIRIYRGSTGNANREQGIFGFVSESANIHDIILADARITGERYTGGIVGYNVGTVSGCHVAANVAVCNVQAEVRYYGGIVGGNFGTVNRCTSAATLIKANGTSFLGGIAGHNSNGILRDNLVIGATVPASNNLCGAITSDNGGTLEHNYYAACTVAGKVNATGVGCRNSDISENDGAVPALRDNADNSTAIGLLAAIPATLNLGWGAGKYPMQLADRTLYKDGKWNTLTLPFDVTIADSPLNGAVARKLVAASISGSTLNLTFSEPVSTLEAGTPYIIKWANDTEHPTIVNPVFAGVTVSADKHDYDTDADTNVTTDERVRFVGTYESTAFDSEDKNILFMGAGNTLCYPAANAGVGAQRAYFKIGDDGVQQARRLTAFSFNFFDGQNGGGEEQATGIITIEREGAETGNAADVWHTMDGSGLSGKPTQSGIYIHNGKKVVIK